jgi:four helix bundle protein
MEIKSYRDLLVWQKAMELVVMCYKLTEKLPKAETFGLCSKIQNTASSIPAYIADGHSRETTAEFLSRLSSVLGFVAALETHLLLVEMLTFLPISEVQPVLDKCAEVGRMTHGLMKSLRSGRS